MTKQQAKLENWAVVDSVVSQSFHALQPGRHLTGYVSGHANLPNTKYIYTSPIVSIDSHQGMVETRNTVYMLGEPSQEYRTWYNERRESAA